VNEMPQHWAVRVLTQTLLHSLPRIDGRRLGLPKVPKELPDLLGRIIKRRAAFVMRALKVPFCRPGAMSDVGQVRPPPAPPPARRFGLPIGRPTACAGSRTGCSIRAAADLEIDGLLFPPIAHLLE
jgi:hypothetical protein